MHSYGGKPNSTGAPRSDKGWKDRYFFIRKEGLFDPVGSSNWTFGCPRKEYPPTKERLARRTGRGRKRNQRRKSENRIRPDTETTRSPFTGRDRDHQPRRLSSKETKTLEPQPTKGKRAYGAHAEEQRAPIQNKHGTKDSSFIRLMQPNDPNWIAMTPDRSIRRPCLRRISPEKWSGDQKLAEKTRSWKPSVDFSHVGCRARQLQARSGAMWTNFTATPEAGEDDSMAVKPAKSLGKMANQQRVTAGPPTEKSSHT
ncbi:hypothetical protein FNV43_RR03650 [Rhamnella rubrinervis]|uniref:Uncharacterized protein n=1 Tax=Rhamnella rubrinervis TaxID=2594499 RepID=A0A8K0HI38_9ROSA|nr:hypothetical protein FNV43_RR03650 [Rhamnella rubrinervis]